MCFIDDLPKISTKDNNCVRCFDHCYYGKPTTIITHLYFTFDNLIKNYNILPKQNSLNRDNNELLHLECYKNNIKLNVNQKQMVEIINFT